MTVATRSVIIAGSRSLRPTVQDVDAVVRGLRWPRATSDELAWLTHPELWDEVVCGMANGPDLAGKAWAESIGRPVHEEPVTTADIQKWGKYLGPKMRNHRMSQRADAAIILWDGRSGGSSDMAARMQMRNKSCEVVRWDPPSGATSADRRTALDRAIREAVDAGLSYAAIADKLKITPRQAARMVAKITEGR